MDDGTAAAPPQHPPAPSPRIIRARRLDGGTMPHFDLAHGTRNFAVCTTVVSVLFALVSLAAGVYICRLELSGTSLSLHDPVGSAWGFSKQLGKSFSVSPVVAEALRFVLNALITLFTEATGFIQATTTRWTLAYEVDSYSLQSRLYFKTNPRILTWAHTWANGFLGLTLYAITLIALYTAASFAFLTPSNSIVECWDGMRITPVSTYDPKINYSATYVPFGPLLTLGVCLLLQAILAAAAIRSRSPATWSSNPLVVAQAAYERGVVDPRQVSRDSRDHGRLSLWSFAPRARIILYVSWLIACLSFAGAIAGVCVVAFARVPGCHVRRGTWAPLAADANALVLRLPIFPTFMIMWAVQGVVTLALHCCELIVNMSADESIWRTVVHGAPREQNFLLSLLTPAQKSGLLFSKPVLLWAFGNVAGFTEGDGFAFRPINMLLFEVLFAIFMGFITHLARRQLRSALPTTYGHVQTLVNLVETWPKTPSEPLHASALVISNQYLPNVSSVPRRSTYERLPSSAYS